MLTIGLPFLVDTVMLVAPFFLPRTTPFFGVSVMLIAPFLVDHGFFLTTSTEKGQRVILSGAPFFNCPRLDYDDWPTLFC
jgi:hypothetical protein